MNDTVDDILKNPENHMGIVFELEKSGFTTEEALEMAKLADHIFRIHPEIGYEQLMDAFRTLFIVPRVERETLERWVDEGAFDRVQILPKDELERILKHREEVIQ